MKDRSLHDRIIIKINQIAGVLALISMCMVDSESWIPFIMVVVSLSWLALFAYANGYLE